MHRLIGLVIIKTSILLLFLCLIISGAVSQHIVKTLPGFHGDLPFKLETGYVSVGKNDIKQLFYYFVESEADPDNNPIFVSLSGGPGCSTLTAFTFEYGPIAFDPSTYGQRLPSLILNPYSWTKVANIIFLDWPVGAGFSYATKPEGYFTSDSTAPKELYEFIRKWLLNHPKFIKNPFYVQGESYAGLIAPLIALEIIKANEEDVLPKINLQGYFVGSPGVNGNLNTNHRIPYGHSMALISDEYLEKAEKSCNKEYAVVDENNQECQNAIQVIYECIEGVDMYHILEPACPNNTEAIRWQDTILEDLPNHIVLPSTRSPLDLPCRGRFYHIAEHWMDNAIVREALGVRDGTKGDWIRCNFTSDDAYKKDISHSEDYYLQLIKKGYPGLVYVGDHDMTVPYTATLAWIRSLNLSVDEDWRPWTVKGQTAGFTMKFKGYGTYLTFASVKDSGHTPAEYAPKQSFEMISRWFSHQPL